MWHIIFATLLGIPIVAIALAIMYGWLRLTYLLGDSLVPENEKGDEFNWTVGVVTQMLIALLLVGSYFVGHLILQ